MPGCPTARNGRCASFPLMMVFAAPLPVMVSAPPLLSRSGSGDCSVITPLAEEANSITSAADVAMAWVIAWRRLPAPLSLVLVTVYVAAAAGAANHVSSSPAHTHSHSSRCRVDSRVCGRRYGMAGSPEEMGRPRADPEASLARAGNGTGNGRKRDGSPLSGQCTYRTRGCTQRTSAPLRALGVHADGRCRS